MFTNTKYFDTHAHIFLQFYSKLQQEKIISNLSQQNIKKVFNIATNINECFEVIDLFHRFPSIFPPIVGLHPDILTSNEFKTRQITTYEISNLIIDNIEKLESIISDNINDIIAIGECGLDYKNLLNTPDQAAKRNQKFLFEEQILLAIKYNLPLVIHCRDAYHDIIPILTKYKGAVKGVIHSISSTVDQADTLIQLGFNLSFNGIMTFKNATNILNIAKRVPLNTILLETDSPFLSPEPFRGEINSPENIITIYDFFSKTRDLSVPELKLIIQENISALFSKL